jgi:hypothetical protein
VVASCHREATQRVCARGRERSSSSSSSSSQSSCYPRGRHQHCPRRYSPTSIGVYLEVGVALSTRCHPSLLSPTSVCWGDSRVNIMGDGGGNTTNCKTLTTIDEHSLGLCSHCSPPLLLARHLWHLPPTLAQHLPARTFARESAVLPPTTAILLILPYPRPRSRLAGSSTSSHLQTRGEVGSAASYFCSQSSRASEHFTKAGRIREVQVQQAPTTNHRAQSSRGEQHFSELSASHVAPAARRARTDPPPTESGRRRCS